MEILEQYNFNVKPFSKLIVGDPMYLVNMQTKKSTTKYIANYDRIPIGKRITGFCLMEKEDDVFEKESILIYSVKDNTVGKKLIELHKRGGCIPDLLEERLYLKNDKKKLLIQVDDKKTIIPLDEDGDCGNIYVYKNRYAYFVEINPVNYELSLSDYASAMEKVFTDINQKYEQMEF